jgi:hypothetical protein
MISPLPSQRADVAQSVEHILGKDEVTSSNLVISSNVKPSRHKGMRVFICYVNIIAILPLTADLTATRILEEGKTHFIACEK